MKINWKVRLKNPVFWLTVIPAVLALIYTVLGLFGVVPTISEDKIVNAVTAIISVLTTIGVLVDPTTKGICDSDRALCYEVPGGEEKEEKG
ncbi:MAG: phage holin [Acutalibacteraceae bacterium]